LILGTHLILVGLIQGTHDWSFLVEESAKLVHRDRAKGPFPNAVSFGIVLACLLPVSLFLYLQARSRLARCAALCLTGGLIEVIVFSKARAVWIGIGAALLVAAARCPRLRWPAGAIVIAMLGQIALAFLPSVTPTTTTTTAARSASMRERVTEVDSLFNRVAIYVTDVNMIAQRPLFGFGFGLSTFAEHRADHAASCCGVPVRYADDCLVPHNEVVNVLILMGAVGLLAYLVVVWRVWSLLAAATRSTDSTRAGLALCALTIFVMLVVVGQTHDLMYLGYVNLLFLFMFGMVAASEPGGTAGA
jgi:O-antigen ligase